MDAGTNAYDILSGQAVPLRLGYVAVVNRSQQDIIDNVPIERSLKNEEEFFRNHPAYRVISNRCGTPHLSKTLHGVSIQTNLVQFETYNRTDIIASH